MRSNSWTCVPWPLHRAIPVRAFDGAEAAQNAIPVHAFVSDVTGIEEGPSTAVPFGEVVHYAVGLRASDAHANPLEGLRVEFFVLGILDGVHRRRFVEQGLVGPEWAGESQRGGLANLQRKLPVHLRICGCIEDVFIRDPYVRGVWGVLGVGDPSFRKIGLIRPLPPPLHPSKGSYDFWNFAGSEGLVLTFRRGPWFLGFRAGELKGFWGEVVLTFAANCKIYSRILDLCLLELKCEDAFTRVPWVAASMGSLFTSASLVEP